MQHMIQRPWVETMKIREKAEPSLLLAKHANDRQYLYIRQALRFRNCFRVDVFKEDCDLILLKSSTENRYLQRHELPSLTLVVDQITRDPGFLNEFRTDGALNGTAVRSYFTRIQEGTFELNDCFIIDKLDGMTEKGRYYIKDGMHRLVAIGLAAMRGIYQFPVPVYYCSDADSLSK